MIFIYIIMLLLALLPLWKTIRFIRLEEQIRKKGVAATAVVSSIQTQSMGSTTRRVYVDDVYFQYQNRNTGQWHQSVHRTKRHKYKRGQQLDIWYLEEKPDKMIVQGSNRAYVGMLLLSGFVLAAVIIAVYKIHQQLNPV